MDEWGAGRYQPKTKLIEKLMIKTNNSKVLFLKEKYAVGEGTFVYPNRSKYQGHWENGQRDGLGVHKLNDGSKYIGNQKEGSAQER